MNPANRIAFLQEIETVLTNVDGTLEKIFDRVGWTKEFLQNKTSSAVCPFESGHRMPASSLEKHIETCEWVKDGYTRDEKEKAIPSSTFFYEKATTVFSVSIDKSLQNQILTSKSQQFNNRAILASKSCEQDKDVPRTMDRAMTELTSEERFAIYDYAVAQGKAANVQNIFQLEDLHLMLDRKQEEPNKQKSRLEILAEQRDYKRRRQSYRAKNVHITKKSYTEVMRDLIDNQMQVLMPNESENADSNHASSDGSLSHDVKPEVLVEEPNHSSRERYARDRSPKPYDRYRERERPRQSRYDDDHGRQEGYSTRKRRQSDSREKRDSSSSSKRERHHHHSKDSGRAHKSSHKKHSHRRHQRSSED